MKPPDAEVERKVRRWLAYADEDLRFAEHGFSVSSFLHMGSPRSG
jgi:hypothetical protein